MTDRPQITLDWKSHWCPGHMEPLRARWPTGAAIAMMALLEHVLEDDRISAACPQHDGLADAHALNAVLLEFAPLCCLVGDEAMADVYLKAGVGL
jgi:hypothetical protein